MKNVLLSSFIILSVIPASAQLLKPIKQIDTSDTVLKNADQLPVFYGDVNKYISENLIYPSKAIRKNIEGRVIVQFVIRRNGSIENVGVSKSVHPLLDREAVRIIRNMPRWEPGKQNGNAVDVFFTLPILFQLTD